MTKRELMMTCLNHEEGPVPQWMMGFFNKALAVRLVPGLMYPTFYHLPEEGSLRL